MKGESLLNSEKKIVTPNSRVPHGNGFDVNGPGGDDDDDDADDDDDDADDDDDDDDDDDNDVTAPDAVALLSLRFASHATHLHMMMHL